MEYLRFADGPWLTLLILAPLVGALLVGVGAALRLPEGLTRPAATLWSLVPLGLAAFVWAGFAPAQTSDGGQQAVVQFAERVPWVEAIRVEYFVGVDGVSLPLVLLTALMTPIAMLAAWNIGERVRALYALILLMEAAMLGYFLSLNFFFFFIFWEFSLVPAYFLIRHWGRSNARTGAALTFFIYTMAGSIGMLLLFQLFYVATATAGIPTFDLIELGRLGRGLPVGSVNDSLQTLVFRYLEGTGAAVFGAQPLIYSSLAFWAVFIAFGVKLAIWPLHTWLPDAYTEAPTAASILLAGVMSKMGAYGLLRVLLPFFPEAAQVFAPAIALLSLAGILAGALGALASTDGDGKRLVAYTSINHMGYVGLAIAAAASGDALSGAIALNGTMVQLIAHGLSTGALFLLLGAIADRTGTTDLRRLGGLRRTMPLLAGGFGVALFANLGLPGLAGFVGEFYIFRGAWGAFPIITLFATIGLVVTALALLQLYNRLFHGPLDTRLASLPDLRPGGREWLALLPLLALLLAFGLYPAPLMDIASTTMTALAGQ